MLRSTALRISSGLLNKYQRCSSTSNPVPSLEKISDSVQETSGVSTNITKDASAVEKNSPTGKSRLVSNAFASLQHNHYTTTNSPLDESIRLAKTPEELLTLSDNSILTKKQALKIISTLSEWSMNGKSDDFESDPRFVALCQMVSKPASGRYPPTVKEGDLSVVLGVMGEDEAAKMINSITLPQMIKVLTSLSGKRRRSLPLLKALAFNIGHSSPKLDVKQSADILYAIASLNFPDEVLLEKVCFDLLETIPICKKSAVIGSICTSIGLMRYKDVELLESLCSWMAENKAITRNQELVSLLLCLASVRHSPRPQIIDIVTSGISENDLPTASTWLDVVWSLAVLECVQEDHISSVLSPKFVERLSQSLRSSSTAWKRKLLNINGLAKFTVGYKGPFLKEELNLEVPFTKSKDKEQIFTSVIDTFTNIFPSANHFRSSVDTGMGFLIDAECMFDAKMNSVSLVDKKTGQALPFNGKRIALLIHDYHECTRGRVEPSGGPALNSRLLTLAGYKVIPLVYTDYQPQSKLLDRAKYLDGLLKAAASPSN